MRAPIHSKKHYIQTSLGSVTSGAANAILLAQGVETPSVANHVSEGSVLKAVFVEHWVRASAAGQGAVLITLLKAPDLQTPLFTDMVALQDYSNKKNIFYHTQGLTNQDTADAIPFIRGWFKIPKSKQRFGLGDSLFLVITAQALTAEHCGFATYKEYT